MPVMGWVATPRGAHWGRVAISIRRCNGCQDSAMRQKTKLIARDGTADGSAAFEKRFYRYRGDEKVEMGVEKGEDRREGAEVRDCSRCGWVDD